MAKIEAPWTPQQVANLNRWQTAARFHAFTCGAENRMDNDHLSYAIAHGGDCGQLVASVNGWFCPVCSYRQTWAHDFMAEPIPEEP